ncbi:MAG: phosphoribosylglycinamide formyltransferase [Rhizobiales bacterium 62-47]|nr:phosphoribosylglycinamide formyltransferase [Hyphomicrobiales bacterium]OJY09987.1 MAG: phosphoribosylglycinamide formyltransferase [Rhizobiales bacterium 62-47]
MKRRVAILISGRGSNMVALIEGARAADYPADIALVISNKPDAAGLARAQESGIKTIVIDSKPFGKDRAAFEAVMQNALDEHRIDLICLGGFMRLLTDDFVNRWTGRMLNIHPSLLPSFRGLDPHGQALRAGVKLSGATVHFVTPEMDAGPIVMQGAVTVRDDDTAETLAARVLEIEHRIYPAALRLVASGSTRIDGDICKIAATDCSNGTLTAPTTV